MATANLPTRPNPINSDVGAIWRAAIDRYEKTTLVKIDSLAKFNNVDEILAELQRQETEIKDHRHDGSKLDRFRTLLSRSLNPLQQLCDIVAVVASIPFPPSTAIFTAISYLLKASLATFLLGWPLTKSQTANSVSADYDKIVRFFEELDSYLNRLKILERHISPSSGLEVAIAEVLTSILVLCGFCAKYAKKKRIGKAFQALVSGEDNELSTAYADFHKAVSKEQGAVMNTTLAIVGQLEKESTGIQAGVRETLLIAERTDLSTKTLMASTKQLNESFHSQMTTLERHEVLANLSLVDFHEKQKDILAHHHVGTGQWLLDTGQFQEWLTGKENSTLWCPGIPGAGKTVMTSLAVNHVHESTQSTGAAIAYIYCDYKVPETRSELHLLASIARQLTEQTRFVPAVVQEFCDKQATRRRNPTSDELISLVKSICLLFPATYVFVDALDECPEINRESFLFSIGQLESVARFFITCRPSLDLQASFTNIARIDIFAKTSDIQAYLEHAIGRDRKISRFTTEDVNLKGDIIQRVSDRASGMFLLAHLQLDYLCRQPSLKAVRKAMSALPREIFEYYGETVKRIDCQYDENSQLARRALSYIFCAMRPWNVLELRHVLAVEAGDTRWDPGALPDLENLLNAAIGLLRIDDESHTIGLVHYTLQEFLEEHPENLLPHPDVEIAKASLTYLSFDIFEQGPCKSGEGLRQRLEDYHFLDYASHHWGHHIRKNQLHTSLKNMLSIFLKDKEKLASFVQILHLTSRRKPKWYDCYPKDFGALHVVAYWGLDEILALNFRDKASVNIRDSYGATALQQAAEHGHNAVVRFLLSKGAEVNTSNEKGETPLYWAARNGHQSMVELLLTSNANVLTKDIEGWTALDWTAIGGNVDILQILLKYGADVVAEDDGKSKALILAAGSGHEPTVQMLLDSGANINARDWIGSTALDWAAPSGNENMVRLLLHNRADPNSRDNYGNTALHWATPYRALVRLLLDHGAEVDSKNNKEQTSLCWAAQDGSVDVAELLLENGADINVQDVYGFTALHRAVLRDRQAMVQLLLRKGANPNIRDKDRWTPLHIAALKQFENLIGLLQDHVDNSEDILSWVNLQLQDKRKHALLGEAIEKKAEASTVNTGLRAAIQERQFGRSQLLLDRGADVDGKDVGGWTALILAASTGDLEAMQLLLENGADIDLGGHDSRTPLHQASELGEMAAVKLLVERGANIEAKTFEWTAILLAASNGHAEIVNLLIQSGADVNAEDYCGRTALHWAAKYGSKETVRLLVDKGANLNTSDYWGKTALMWAIENHQIRIVRTLLMKKADIDIEAKARHNVTALHIAAFLGCESSTRRLLEKGANADVVASWCKAEDIVDHELLTMSTINDSLTDVIRHWCLEQGDPNSTVLEARRGITARQLAVKGKHVAVQKLLGSNFC